MWPFIVVEPEIVSEAFFQILHRLIVLDVR
jgi:hypothetical protein